jgi:hypothetical protein
MWQRVDFVTDRKSVGRGLHNLACPIPMWGQAIELDKNDIKRQMVEFANHVPEESEGA